MAEIVYILCALTSCLCAALLLRAYFRNPTRLLLWTALAFVGLAANNILLFVDLVIIPEQDLEFYRNLTALSGMAILIYGLIWEAE